MSNLLKSLTSEPRAYRYVGHLLFASALVVALQMATQWGLLN